MKAEELRAIQKPVKDRYRSEPETALFTLKAEGKVGQGITCNVRTRNGVVEAGLHRGTGGDGTKVCSGDMLLEALVACAGVTLAAVATSMGVTLRDAVIRAEGDIDFRGTLGVSRDVQVGFRKIRLTFELGTNAPSETRAKLISLTERYCVVYQTLLHSPQFELSDRNRTEETTGIST